MVKHPVYKNQLLGFDLKYDTSEIINLEIDELHEVFKNKSYFRKIKLNKQPSILDKSFSRGQTPYSNFSDEEIQLKCKQLDNEDFKQKIERILERIR